LKKTDCKADHTAYTKAVSTEKTSKKTKSTDKTTAATKLAAYNKAVKAHTDAVTH